MIARKCGASMIWNDRRIYEWAATGGVSPFAEDCINPASLDLRLGDTIRLPRRRWAMHEIDAVGKKTPALKLWEEPLKFERHILWPGDLALCHSEEFTIIPITACAMLLSKSSTGRLGLEHLHAGWGDCGFSGQWVFELKNLAPWPIELVAGEKYMQLVIMDMAEAPLRDYSQTGRYQGQRGPEAHR